MGYVKRFGSGVENPCLGKASVFQTQVSDDGQPFEIATGFPSATVPPSERRLHFLDGGFQPPSESLPYLKPAHTYPNELSAGGGFTLSQLPQLQ
ncbi:MAG: hypothetical protein NT023_23540 [Armatimonadetes bacterium]|nr:hypothetical protein [Armatimonadota bacterium]